MAFLTKLWKVLQKYSKLCLAGLSYNDMFISQQGNSWPDPNIMQMVNIMAK
jgi:hypothetical protein